MFPTPPHFVAILVICVVMGGILFFLPLTLPQYQIACTTETKQCPDGSYVGRTGPQCEFEACPTLSCEDDGACQGSADGPQKDVPSDERAGILPYYSGVRGTVLLGPTCPVERTPPDTACADKPYSTVVSVYRERDSTHAFAVTRSGDSGVFEMSLPPGRYFLGAGESVLPRCESQTIVVDPSGYTTVAIICDTGIR